MRTLWMALAGLFFVSMVPSAAVRAQLSPGNIVVLQAGTGAAALSSAATPVFLKEFSAVTPNQPRPLDSVIVPFSGPNRLTISGTATSEGQITLSADSLKIVIAGYDTSSGYAGVASSASATVNRAVDTVGQSGIAGRAASTASQYSGNNLRCATRGTGDDFWGAGGTSGTCYFGTTAPAAPVQTANANTRAVRAQNGNLYYTSSSGTASFYKIAGYATASATPVTLFATGTGSAPNAFAVNPSETIVYIADDRAASAGGGIQKWVYSGGSWGTAPAYTLKLDTVGARGVTVDFSGAYPVVCAVSADAAGKQNRIVRIVDSGLMNSGFITLATAPLNTVFRGIAASPKASCQTPVLALSVTHVSCSGGSNGAISVTLTSGSTPVSYSWTGPNGYTAATQNISGLIAGVYQVTAVANGGCSATYSATLTQPAALQDSIYSNAPVCAGTTLQLGSTASGATTPYRYSWTGPNNFSDTTASPSIPNAGTSASGSYTLTVTSPGGCTASATKFFTVNPAPAAGFTVNNGTQPISGNNFLFTSTGSTTGNTYTWSFGDNTSSGAVNPSKTYSATGTYTVQQLIVNGSGCRDSASRQVTVTSDSTRARFTVNSASQCFNTQSFAFTNSSAGSAPLTYNWSFGDNTFSTSANPTKTYTAAGTYTVRLRASGSGGTDSFQLSVIVKPAPANLTASANSPVCEGSTLQLTDSTTTAGVSLSWSGPNGFSSTTHNPSVANVSTAASGSYKVIAGLNGCMDSASVSVSVNTAPPPAVSSPVIYCQFASATPLTATGSGLMWYASVSGAGSSTAPTPSTSTAGNTSYYVSQTVNGCTSDKSTIVVQIVAQPAAPAVTTPLDYCVSAPSAALTAAGSNLIWYGVQTGGAGSSTAPTPSTGTPGNTSYYVSQTVNGCESNRSAIQVRVHANPADLQIAGNTPVCAGATLHLSGTTTAQVSSYSWSGPNGFQSALAGPSVSPVVAGTYRLVISDSFGCRRSDSLSVTVNPLASVDSIVVTPMADSFGFAAVNPVAVQSYSWTFGDGATSTAPAPTHRYSANGTYTVRLIVSNGCGSDTAVQTLSHSATGIYESRSEQPVRVYPNPATGRVTVEMPGATTGRILLTDLQGRVLREQPVQASDRASMPLDGVAPGSYYLIIHTDKGHAQRPLLIVR